MFNIIITDDRNQQFYVMPNFLLHWKLNKVKFLIRNSNIEVKYFKA